MKSRRTKMIITVTAALLVALQFFIPASAADAGGMKQLIPGGMPFGVKLFSRGAIVLGTTGVETAGGIKSPAKDCGICAGDVIIRAGGREFETAEELTAIISGSGGKKITLAYIREGVEFTASVTPARDFESGEYRIGALVRDSAAGIGTVTFIDPETLDFGGLGHGIYDMTTGVLMPLRNGVVVGVDITSVVKSRHGEPGELRGEFDSVASGDLWANKNEGVFGRFYTMPPSCGAAVPVAAPGEITAGKADIFTTLKGERTEKFEVEIERVYSASGNTKNFLIRVTDPRLLSAAGGIVQGMSGSPVIQNGKLVGAVTHVLVNDPVHGYGIFIENMLSSGFDVTGAHAAPENLSCRAA